MSLSKIILVDIGTFVLEDQQHFTNKQVIHKGYVLQKYEKKLTHSKSRVEKKKHIHVSTLQEKVSVNNCRSNDKSSIVTVYSICRCGHLKISLSVIKRPSTYWFSSIDSFILKNEAHICCYFFFHFNNFR